MDKRKISNITSYFQVVKSAVNVSANSEQILGQNIVVNTFTAKGFSQTRPFMHLGNHVFRSQ